MKNILKKILITGILQQPRIHNARPPNHDFPLSVQLGPMDRVHLWNSKGPSQSSRRRLLRFHALGSDTEGNPAFGGILPISFSCSQYRIVERSLPRKHQLKSSWIKYFTSSRRFYKNIKNWIYLMFSVKMCALILEISFIKKWTNGRRCVVFKRISALLCCYVQHLQPTLGERCPVRMRTSNTTQHLLAYTPWLLL